MQEKIADNLNKFQSQLTTLGECPEGKKYDPKVLNHQAKQGKIMQALEKAKFELAKEWWESKLF